MEFLIVHRGIKQNAEFQDVYPTKCKNVPTEEDIRRELPLRESEGDLDLITVTEITWDIINGV